MVLYRSPGDLIEARTKYLPARKSTCGTAGGQNVMYALGSGGTCTEIIVAMPIFGLHKSFISTLTFVLC